MDDYERLFGVILTKIENIEKMMERHFEEDREHMRKTERLERYANKLAGVTLVITLFAGGLASYVIQKVLS